MRPLKPSFARWKRFWTRLAEGCDAKSAFKSTFQWAQQLCRAPLAFQERSCFSARQNGFHGQNYAFALDVQQWQDRAIFLLHCSSAVTEWKTDFGRTGAYNPLAPWAHALSIGWQGITQSCKRAVLGIEPRASHTLSKNRATAPNRIDVETQAPTSVSIGPCRKIWEEDLWSMRDVWRCV